MRPHDVGLRASARRMRGIPRAVPAAVAIRHADLHGRSDAVAPHHLAARTRRIACVVTARVVDIRAGIGAAVGLGSGDLEGEN